MQSPLQIHVFLTGKDTTEVDMMSGVFEAFSHRPHWRMHLHRSYAAVTLPSFRGYPKPDGMLVGPRLQKVQKELQKLDAPMVILETGGAIEAEGVFFDHEQTGTQALHHLRDAGYENLMFFGNGTSSNSKIREQAFLREAGKYSLTPTVFYEGPRQKKARTWRLEYQLLDLAEILNELPRPIGIFANDDVHGERAVQAALTTGMSIPGEVGILCHSNYELFCKSCTPTLSSITFPFAECAKQAVMILENRLLNPGSPIQRQVIRPSTVTPRQSTDLTSVQEPDIAQFLSRLRAEIGNEPNLTKLALEVGMSRRTLERRLKSRTGKNPGDYLRTFRQQAALHLLQETDMDLATIAAEVGYADKSVLSRVMNQTFGTTPGKLRRKNNEPLVVTSWNQSSMPVENL